MDKDTYHIICKMKFIDFDNPNVNARYKSMDMPLHVETALTEPNIVLSIKDDHHNKHNIF